MRIEVRLHTILQRNTPQGRLDHFTLDLPAGSNLQTVLDQLDIPIKLEDLLLVINAKTAGPDQILEEGDEVDLIPAIAGGLL